MCVTQLQHHDRHFEPPPALARALPVFLEAWQRNGPELQRPLPLRDSLHDELKEQAARMHGNLLVHAFKNLPRFLRRCCRVVVRHEVLAWAVQQRRQHGSYPTQHHLPGERVLAGTADVVFDSIVYHAGHGQLQLPNLADMLRGDQHAALRAAVAPRLEERWALLFHVLQQRRLLPLAGHRDVDAEEDEEEVEEELEVAAARDHKLTRRLQVMFLLLQQVEDSVDYVHALVQGQPAPPARVTQVLANAEWYKKQLFSLTPQSGFMPAHTHVVPSNVKELVNCHWLEAASMAAASTETQYAGKIVNTPLKKLSRRAGNSARHERRFERRVLRSNGGSSSASGSGVGSSSSSSSGGSGSCGKDGGSGGGSVQDCSAIAAVFGGGGRGHRRRHVTGGPEPLEPYFDFGKLMSLLPKGHRFAGGFLSDGVDVCIGMERPARGGPPERSREAREARQAAAVSAAQRVVREEPYGDRLFVSVDPGLVTPIVAVPGNVLGNTFVPAWGATPPARAPTHFDRRYLKRDQETMAEQVAAAAAAAAAAPAAAVGAAAAAGGPGDAAAAPAAAAAAAEQLHPPRTRPRPPFSTITMSSQEFWPIATYGRRARQQEEWLRDAPGDLQRWQSEIPTGKSARLERLLDRVAYVAPRLQEIVGHYATWDQRMACFNAYRGQQRAVDEACKRITCWRKGLGRRFEQRRVVVFFGSGSAGHGGPIRRRRRLPFKKIKGHLRSHYAAAVVIVDEYNTSNTCINQECREHEQPQQVAAAWHAVPALPEQQQVAAAGHALPALPEQQQQQQVAAAGHALPALPEQQQVAAAWHAVPALPEQQQLAAAGHAVPALPEQQQVAAAGHAVPPLPEQQQVAAAGHAVPALPEQQQQQGWGGPAAAAAGVGPAAAQAPCPMPNCSLQFHNHGGRDHGHTLVDMEVAGHDVAAAGGGGDGGGGHARRQRVKVWTHCGTRFARDTVAAINIGDCGVCKICGLQRPLPLRRPAANDPHPDGDPDNPPPGGGPAH